MQLLINSVSTSDIFYVKTPGDTLRFPQEDPSSHFVYWDSLPAITLGDLAQELQTDRFTAKNASLVEEIKWQRV